VAKREFLALVGFFAVFLKGMKMEFKWEATSLAGKARLGIEPFARCICYTVQHLRPAKPHRPCY
jgi:hypothetical protein